MRLTSMSPTEWHDRYSQPPWFTKSVSESLEVADYRERSACGSTQASLHWFSDVGVPSM